MTRQTGPSATRRIELSLAALLASACRVPTAPAQQAGAVLPNEIQVVFQTGHGSALTGVALSTDGSLIASRAWDQTVRIWDVASGQEVRTISGLEPETHITGFIGDTARLVVGDATKLDIVDSGSGQRLPTPFAQGARYVVSALGRYAAVKPPMPGTPITILDLVSGREGGSAKADQFTSPLAVSDDGRMLLVQRVDIDMKKMEKMLRRGQMPPTPGFLLELWDVPAGKRRPVAAVSAAGVGPGMAVLSPDGKLLAVADIDSTLSLYDTATGARRAQWPPDQTADLAATNSIVFSPDSRLIARAAQSGGVNVWDIASGQSLSHFEGTSVNFSADGKTLVVGHGTGGAPLLRDLKSGLETALAGGASAIVDLALVDDGRGLVAATEGGGARFWDLATGQLVRSFQCAAGVQVQSVSVSPRQPLLAMGCRDGAVQLWNLLDGKLVRTVVAPIIQTNGLFAVVRFDPTGARVAAAINDQVSIWDASTGAPVSRFTLPKGQQTMFAPDAVAGFTAKLGEAQRESFNRMLNDPRMQALQSAAMSMAFHPGGQHLALGQQQALTLWDVTTGKLVRQYSNGGPQRMPQNGAVEDLADSLAEDLPDDGARSMSFSPDGRQLVSIGLFGELVWDVETARASTDAQPPDDGRDDSPLSQGVAVSPDGRFAARGRGQYVDVWDLRSGRTVASLAGHLSDVNSVAYAAGGKLLVSGARDGAVRLWSLPEGRPIAQLIALGASDYVAVTPDQYYRASRRRLGGVSFRVGNQLYPFEQFDLRFNRPDVVLARLGRAQPEVVQAYRTAYERRLRRMGISESALSGEVHLPAAQIVDTKVPVTTSARTLALRIRASDARYPLDRVNVFVNDVPVFGTTGLPVADRAARSLTQDIQVPLVPGRNKIQVSVLNQQGGESLRETAYTSATGDFGAQDVYLVAIGVSEYENSAYNLRFAAKDAGDLVNAYKGIAQRAGARGTVHVLDLTNAKATRASIREAKEWLKQAKSNDLVVVFAAGHGMTDAQHNYYFGTHDIDPAHPETKGLPYEDFEGLLDGIASLQKVLLIDTCFSGEIEKDEATPVTRASGAGIVSMRAFKAARGVTVVADTSVGQTIPGDIGAQAGATVSTDTLRFQQDLFADLRRGTGAVVISSASGNEYALEGEQWRNGVFTYALLNGLKNAKADKNADARITVSELQSFVIDQVRELTAGGQNPTVRRENLDYDFTVF